MVKRLNASEVHQLIDDSFGVKLTEVDLSEFDRRKAPRLESYDVFVQSLESAAVEIKFIV